MALDGTYSGLQASVGDWLNRADLTTQIVDFIKLAEAQIQRVLRRTSVRTTITLSGDTYTLDNTVAELRSLRLVSSVPTSDLPITVGTPEWFWEMKALLGGGKGRPVVASIIAGKLLVAPVPDQNYNVEMVYYLKLVPLSSANPTNIVLTEAPDLYLFGALKEAAPYLKADERVMLWEDKFNSAISQLATVREREETNASLRPIKLPRVFG